MPVARARDLGVPFEGAPGPLNAITDVAGVTVGQTTLIEDLANGRKVRTGVTAILPRGRDSITTPVFAGDHVLNGAGEMTGRAWIEEGGMLEGPVMLTNTHSVGTVHEATIAWRVRNGNPDSSGYWWSTPVVAETWDGELNDVNGFHVKASHVDAALDGAKGGPVAEGNVGGGTGMTCHGFKCGIGTSSRRVDVKGRAYHGRRARAGELRNTRVAAHRRRSGRPASRRGRAFLPVVFRRRQGLDHHRRCDGCAAPSAPAPAHRASRGHGARAHGLVRGQWLRRHLRRVLDGEREGHGRRRNPGRGVPGQRLLSMCCSRERCRRPRKRSSTR